MLINRTVEWTSTEVVIKIWRYVLKVDDIHDERFESSSWGGIPHFGMSGQGMGSGLSLFRSHVDADSLRECDLVECSYQNYLGRVRAERGALLLNINVLLRQSHAVHEILLGVDEIIFTNPCIARCLGGKYVIGVSF